MSSTDHIIRVGQDQVLLVLSPQRWSSDTQLSGEALPGEGNLVGGEAPLLLPWESSGEPRARSYRRPTGPHRAGVGRRGASKQVCWRSGGVG